MDDAAGTTVPIPTHPSHRRWRRVLLTLAGLALLALLLIGSMLDRFGQVDRTRPAEAIVVLGAGVQPDGSPGDSLRTRTLQAVALYQHGLSKHFIFTGGHGDYGDAESVIESQMAMARGVPAGAIFREDTSHTTRENIRNAALICRQQGWREVIVVSDPYHLWRARYLFAHEGITAYPSPAKDCLRNRNMLLRIVWTARETLAVVHDVAVECLSERY